MNVCKIIKKTCWLVIASASLCIGLAAFGVDVEAVLGIAQFDMYLRYLVGVCGLISLGLMIKPCSSGASSCTTKK